MDGARAARRGVHKVGLTTAVLGLAALFALSFASLRGSRIQSGVDLSAPASIGWGWTGLLVALWLLAAACSLRDDRRMLSSAARGIAASAVIVAAVALSEVAAVRLAEGAAQFARVSIGPGVWLTCLAAYGLVLASRRELGRTTPLAIALAATSPACVAVLAATGRLGHLGMMREYAGVSARFWAEASRHVLFAAVSVAIAVVVGGTLGLLAFRYRRLERPVFFVVNVFQTIPGLAMIGLLVVPLAALSRAVPGLRAIGFGGLGWAPVVTALTLYALLAVVRNTYVGLSGVPADTVEAGLGMGMTGGQVMRRVRFPLAMPVLLSGVRTAAIQTVGNATLGAFAAAGTLGLFVFGGLSQQSTDLIMLGSVAVVLLAVAADGVMRGAARLLTPGHVRKAGAP